MGCQPADRLSVEARQAIENVRNELIFSSASLWAVAIKSVLGRPDFRVDARVLRRCLLENGYGELAIAGDHAVAS
jgi:PIN domain nuclease of toxin-antitoxin system